MKRGGSRPVELGRFLKESRIRAGYSQLEVAHRVGYNTAQVVSDWERDVQSPPGRALRKLTTIYNISIDDIYTIMLEAGISRLKLKLRRAVYG